MKQITALVIVTVGCFVGLATIGSGWIRAFARTEQPLIYASGFSLLMFISLLLVQRFTEKASLWKRTVALFALGELSSVIALAVSIATYPRILSRMSNMMTIGSISDTLVAVLFSSLLLGGWLLVPVGAVVAEILARCKISK